MGRVWPRHGQRGRPLNLIVRAQQNVAYEKKVVLHCPAGYKPALGQMVEDFLKDGVSLVAVVGKDCAKVEDIIDELVVGDASDPHRFITTSSHPNESVVDVVEFASLCVETGRERYSLLSSNKSLERTCSRRGRAALAINCVLAGADWAPCQAAQLSR